MQKKKGFIRSWLFIGLVIIVVFFLSGVGLAIAYKNGKLTQAQNPTALPSSDVAAASRTIVKTVSPADLNQGDPFNITLDIPGIKDSTGQMSPADVMFVIDNSESMDRPAEPGGCVMYVNNDPSQPRIRPHAQRLCFAKTAVTYLMEQFALKNIPVRAGYQTFSSYGETLNDYHDYGTKRFYRFMGLTDLNDDNARTDLEANLMGPFADTGDDHYQMQKGTAMGLGIEKAVRELKDHGDPNAAKYIVLLSDGDENVNPSTSGCQTGKWPTSWPPDYDGCDLGFENITDRLYNHQHPNERLLTPEMVHPLVRPSAELFCDQQGRDPCNFSANEVKNASPCGWMKTGETPHPLCDVQNRLLPWYSGSPADEAQQNGIKVFSVGYYGRGSNTNESYMVRIAENLYPQEPGGGPGPYPAGYFRAEDDSNYLYQIMEDILGVISNQYRGAPFTMIETLPLNASVTAGNISVWRDGVNLNLTPRLGRDGQGRQTITLDIVPENYSGQTDPNKQTFEVKIQNIQYQCLGNFDADQNYDANGIGLNPKPSYVTWTFPITGRTPITQPMPPGPVRCLTQYSGDIYGTSISNYAFPWIDVSVAQGENSSNQVIWSLSNYNFSSSSFSNYGNFKAHVDKVVSDLEKKARNLNNPNQFFNNPNPNPDTDPEGGIWHATGALSNLTVSGSHVIGNSNNQRATVIVDGDLVFNNGANISRLTNTNNNLLFIVKGNVSIDASVTDIQNVAIVASNSDIIVGNSKLNFKGLLAAKNVILEGGRTSGLQRINYDTSFVLYPPPGLASFDLPIFKEVKP